jgi:hypothetical protein
MKTLLHPTLLLLAALLCAGPVPAAADKTSPGCVGSDEGTVSAAYVREEIETMDKRDPVYRKARTRLLHLLDAGCDPALVDDWISALGDDTVVTGMPADLVLGYFGKPLSREKIVFRGAPAERWTIERKPGRTQVLTVARGKVVAVAG